MVMFYCIDYCRFELELITLSDKEICAYNKKCAFLKNWPLHILYDLAHILHIQ